MRWIKFTMSSGDPISVSKELAEKIIDSSGQLVKIPEVDGTWSGKVINKAHIVSTDYDIKKEQAEAEKARMAIPKLSEPPATPEQRKKIQEGINKIRDKFRIKK